MPGLSGHPRLSDARNKQDVDGRDKPGHDGCELTAGMVLGGSQPRARHGQSILPRPRFVMPVINRVADLQPDIQAWRRDIHAHPELLYDVHRTAAFVADRLREFGCDEVATGLGRTGVVGVIKGRKPAAGDGVKVIGLARRHGRAADRGSHRPALRFQDTRQDARLRPRWPHRDAAGSRAISRRDAEFRGRRRGDLPAGGRGRRGCGRHDQGRA